MSKPDPRTIRQMLKEVEAVTKSRFHADPDPVAGPVEMFRMPDGKKGGDPFAALSVGEKIQVLGDYTRWHDYEERGVSSTQMDQVFRNVIDGKPREQWLEGTGLHADTPGQKADIRGTLRAQLEAKPKVMTERDKLIRANFDAYREHTWLKNLEPKLRAYDLHASEINDFRETWNRETEARDWNRWVEHVKGTPDAKLREEIAECKAEIDAIRKESHGQKPGIRGTLRAQLEAKRQPAPKQKKPDQSRHP
jgi:hypothetical protein